MDVKNKDEALSAFSLFPKRTVINPHEYVYIKITFKPEIMAVYEGTFEAKVIHEEKILKESTFKFDLKGEGILPTLKVIGVNNENIVDFGSIRS